MNREQFGRFIADTRKERGMTQQDLAQKLHVTNTAVSKWERGLSYPDLTLIEELSDALGLSVSELMACQKEETGDAQMSCEESHIRAILNMAKETARLHRREVGTLVGIIVIALILAATVTCYFTVFRVHDTVYAKFAGKQMEGDVCYVYIEKNEHLLRLECPDRGLYDEIYPGVFRYEIEFRWNRLSMEGRLESAVNINETSLGTPLDVVDSTIAVDSLLGIRCVFNCVKHVRTDPKREGGYLYTYRFFYYGDGRDYVQDQKEWQLPLVTLTDCRGFAMQDYDNDGIVELFVLTKYDEVPYQIYDVEDGKIISRFENEVLPEIEEQLYLP